MSKCALCDNEAELRESHIIPRFASEWIKQTSITNGLRHSENVNKRRQDGLKKKLLCQECEQRFGKREKIFAEKIFRPFLNEKVNSFEYSDWLNYFISSVNWRILFLTLCDVLSLESEMSCENFSLLANVSMEIKNYLLEKTEFPKNICNHLHFVDDELFLLIADKYPLTFIKRSCFASVFEDEEYIYVYSSICGILCITIIKQFQLDTWNNTLVVESGGTITTRQFARSPVHVDVRRTVESMCNNEISNEQVSKMFEKFTSTDEEIILKSNFIEQFGKDIDLKDIASKYIKFEE